MKFTKKELKGIVKICDAVVSKMKDSLASDVLSEIKRTNPTATYKIKTKKTTYAQMPDKEYLTTDIEIHYTDKFNKSFFSHLPQGFKIYKVTDRIMQAKRSDGSEIYAEFDWRNPIVFVSTYDLIK